jgi:hypothetical protein
VIGIVRTTPTIIPKRTWRGRTRTLVKLGSKLGNQDSIQKPDVLYPITYIPTVNEVHQVLRLYV